MTATKNASHTFHGIPERSAMMSIRFIVPRSLSRVWSKVSFIFSARADESRISSPIAVVICFIASPYVSLVPMKASAICLVKQNPGRKVVLLLTLTSLRVRTLPMMPSTCASFWLSSSLSTASLYCPLRFGAADRNAPAPPADGGPKLLLFGVE